MGILIFWSFIGTGVCGQLDNFSRYTMVLAAFSSVQCHRGTMYTITLVLTSVSTSWYVIWDNLKSITFYYFIIDQWGIQHDMTSQKVKGVQISPVWSCRWNGHLFVLYRPKQNPKRDDNSEEWNPPFSLASQMTVFVFDRHYLRYSLNKLL